jgi:hypothetical protein
MKLKVNDLHDLVISIHILPYELEEYRRIIHQLNTSAKYIAKSDNIVIHSTLNLNDKLTDWTNSKLTREQAIDLYDTTNSNTIYKNSLHELNSEMLGVDDHRRHSIQIYKQLAKNISYLDCDLYFNEQHLGYMLSGIKKVSVLSEYYILTPQVVRLWDSTWDCLVNEQYKTRSHKFHKTTDPLSIINKPHGKVNIGKYLMRCSESMRKYQYSIRQYILKNSVVMENYTDTNKSFKNNFKINDIRTELLKQTNINYKNECNLFLSKLKRVPYI